MEKIMRKVFLIFLMLLLSVVSYGGFYAKWSVTVNFYHPFDIMIEAKEQPRPYVYRQLVPALTRQITNSLSEETKERLTKKFDDKLGFDKIYPVVRENMPSEKHKFDFYVLSLVIFLFFLVGNFVLRSLLCEILQDEVSGTLTTFLFMLLFPLLESGGGYYYDLTELVFFFAAAKFALHGNYIGLLILTPFAEFNKESFFFFLPMLFPIFGKHFDFKKTSGIILSALLIAGSCYLYARMIYAENPGSTTYNQIFFQLEYLFRPDFYFLTETTYGMPLGGRLYWLHLLMAFWIVKSAWNKLEDTWKNHFKIALAINIPLFMFFCAPGEIRNFSLSWLAFLIPTGFYIKNLISEKLLEGKSAFRL